VPTKPGEIKVKAQSIPPFPPLVVENVKEVMEGTETAVVPAALTKKTKTKRKVKGTGLKAKKLEVKEIMTMPDPYSMPVCRKSFVLLVYTMKIRYFEDTLIFDF